MEEEEGKLGGENSSLILVMTNNNNSPTTTTTMKPPLWFDFATIRRKMMVVLLAIALPCIVIFCVSFNNFGEFLIPSLGRFSSSSSSSFSNYTMIANSSSSSGDLHNELVHDEYYELRKVLKAASTDDNTVILTTLNDAWAEPNSIFDIFLEGFRTGNNTARLLNHLLVVAVDEKAYSRCRATVSHCYFFKSNQSSEMAHEAKFMTPIYMEMMWERLAFLQTILSLGHNFVFTDTDVLWFRDPFPNLSPGIDFQTSCDRFTGKPFDLNNFPNNGFLFVRSNKRTIEFYKFWVSSRWTYPGLHEQDVFNKIKYDSFVKQIGLKFRFLDTNYFGGFCEPSRDFNKVCTMHANCCVGLDKKIADLNTMLEDWRSFVSLQSNQTALQRPHWRVPQRCRIW